MLVGVLSASESLVRLTECIDAGFRIHEISSTSEHVVVDMKKADREVTVELGPEDASAIIGVDEARIAQRVTASRST